MQRRNVDVGDVHRHLSDAILVDIPSYGLGTLQRTGLHDWSAIGVQQFLSDDRVALTHRASLLSHVKRNGVGAACRSCVQIEVHRNEEVACSNHSATRSCHLLVVRATAEVGCLSVVVNALGNALIFTLATHGKVSAFGGECRSLVAIAGNIEFVGNALGELARNLGTLLKRNSAHGYNGQHIGSAYTRMSAVLLAHINKLCGLAHSSEGSLHHISWLAHEGYDSTVGCLAGVDIKQLHTLNALYRVCYLTDYAHVATFAEIRHTLYNLLHFCHSVRYYVSSIKKSNSRSINDTLQI